MAEESPGADEAPDGPQALVRTEDELDHRGHAGEVDQRGHDPQRNGKHLREIPGHAAEVVRRSRARVAPMQADQGENQRADHDGLDPRGIVLFSQGQRQEEVGHQGDRQVVRAAGGDGLREGGGHRHPPGDQPDRGEAQVGEQGEHHRAEDQRDHEERAGALDRLASGQREVSREAPPGANDSGRGVREGQHGHGDQEECEVTAGQQEHCGHREREVVLATRSPVHPAEHVLQPARKEFRMAAHGEQESADRAGDHHVNGFAEQPRKTHGQHSAADVNDLAGGLGIECEAPAQLGDGQHQCGHEADREGDSVFDGHDRLTSSTTNAS